MGACSSAPFSLGGFIASLHLFSNESRNLIEWNKCYAAQLAALPEPDEPPPVVLLTQVIITARESKEWITTAFRQPKSLGREALSAASLGASEINLTGILQPSRTPYSES